MLRAHLNASLKFFTQAPVIDRDDVPALQIRGDVMRELAIMRTLFNDYEVVDLSQLLPNFGKLRTEQLAEQRPHADVGKIIAVSSDRAAAGGIISVFWMVKRLLHKPGE